MAALNGIPQNKGQDQSGQQHPENNPKVTTVTASASFFTRACRNASFLFRGGLGGTAAAKSKAKNNPKKRKGSQAYPVLTGS